MKTRKKATAIMTAAVLANTALFPLNTEAEVTTPTSENNIMGDVNADGKFTAKDISEFQHWLLNDGTELKNWKNADFISDNELDVFDLCLMKKEWSEQNYEESKLPNGWLLWHSYSSYISGDSSLYLQSPDGTVQEITGEFSHAMNGCFGNSPEDIVFMAIDKIADEWDIYNYISETGEIINLTEKSGYRNEDPKISPDGKSIVFKRGKWDNTVNDYIYQLALLERNTGKITLITDDTDEEAMPYFSSDGKYIYYSHYNSGIASIKRMDTENYNTETIYSEPDINAYYPVCGSSNLYFTKWVSADNHNDCIMRYDGEKITPMPFNLDYCNCSDPCPVDENSMIYSCTRDGSYDLFYYNGISSVKLTGLNTDKQELGADFFFNVEQP
ncbi:MAG: hypothetical protein ACI4J2_08090 [Ruminococcus sp.]